MRIITNLEPNDRITSTLRISYYKDIGGYQIIPKGEAHELMMRIPGEWICISRKGSQDELLAVIDMIDESAKDGKTMIDLRQMFTTKGDETFAVKKSRGGRT